MPINASANIYIEQMCIHTRIYIYMPVVYNYSLSQMYKQYNSNVSQGIFTRSLSHQRGRKWKK